MNLLRMTFRLLVVASMGMAPDRSTYLFGLENGSVIKCALRADSLRKLAAHIGAWVSIYLSLSLSLTGSFPRFYFFSVGGVSFNLLPFFRLQFARHFLEQWEHQHHKARPRRCSWPTLITLVCFPSHPSCTPNMILFLSIAEEKEIIL